MNEARLKAYCGLIEQLLACPQGQEMLLLQGHPDLMNRDLLTVMGQVAQMLRQQGKPNGDWLDQVADRLSFLIPEETIAPDNALDFLQQTLQIIVSSEGDPQRIYPWLEAHLSYLNGDLLTVLPGLETRLQALGEPKSQHLFALSLGCFANLLMEFPLGDRVWNLQCAQVGYDIVGRVFQSLGESELWTASQESLVQVERELTSLKQLN